MFYTFACAWIWVFLCGFSSPNQETLVSRHAWAPGAELKGEAAPAVVPYRGGHALEFSRKLSTFHNAGQGMKNELRLKGALSLLAVVELNTPPPGKVSLISKWRLVSGGRSYELGLTSSKQLFFTISASGKWPDRALELMSTRPLAAGVPYAVAAVYEPGKRMALYINAVPSGEAVEGVPENIFDSPTPVLFGSRFGSEETCAFDGLIQGVWIHAAALDRELIAKWTQSQGIVDPPGPEFPVLKPPYDLDVVKESTRAWYSDLRDPGAPFGAYKLTPESPPDLYASADLAWIRWIMNDLDLATEQRKQWIGFIQDQQNPEDGSYRHITGHCRTHAFCHATGALNMLGGRHRYKPGLLEKYQDVNGIPAWLDGIDWVRQWGASHDIWGAGLPLVCTPETPDEWNAALFAWLDCEADPGTGFWRSGIEARSRLEYLGGAFHIWPLYAATGRPLPHAERVIDSVLALQRGDGSFDGVFGYGSMDGVWALAYLGSCSSHRRDDLLVSLEKSALGLMKLFNGKPGRFFSSAHSTESRIAMLAILQSALPTMFESEKPWRNPWHDKKLFVVKY